MRYYISLIAIALIGISILTACQQTPPQIIEVPKTNSAETAKANSAESPQTSPTVKNEDPLAKVPRITLADAKKAFDEGNVVFVDTRAEVQYREEHVKGALNIPAEAFEMRYAEVPKGKKIITYCSWPSEHTSARAVQILNEKGYTNAFALVGGTQAWKNAGYPMEAKK